MSNKAYSLAVYIGRFQPFHLGHRQSLSHAMSIADRVLVLVGSTNQPRSVKNPFTFEERQRMICADFGISNDHPQVIIKPIEDFMYDEAKWIAQVQRIVEQTALDEPWQAGPTKIAIVGFEKDETSYYLRHFPQWDFVSSARHELAIGENHIGATNIRNMLFAGDIHYAKGVLGASVYQCIGDFILGKTEEYLKLQYEYNFLQDYKQKWVNSPFPVTFITTDAVVVQSGHVLLIKRKMSPGKGLWALPGGFLGQNETLFNGCVRELREETGLKVPEPILRASNSASHVFDNPSRSARGRTITMAYLFKLDDSKELPKVKGADDAEKAKWVPLSEFYTMSNQMFDDHWSIINYFLNRQ